MPGDALYTSHGAAHAVAEQRGDQWAATIEVDDTVVWGPEMVASADDALAVLTENLWRFAGCTSG